MRIKTLSATIVTVFTVFITFSTDAMSKGSNRYKTCIGDIAGCYSFPENIDRETLKDNKLNIWVDKDNKQDSYRNTIDLAEKYGVLIKMYAPDHSFRVQIPLIRLYAENVEFENVEESGVHRVYIKSRNPQAVIGSTCLNCSSEEVDSLIAHYQTVIDCAAPDQIIEIDLTRNARNAVRADLEDNYYDPNYVFVVKESSSKFRIYKTSTEVKNFESYRLNDSTDKLILPITVEARMISFPFPVIMETFKKMLRMAKEKRVWVTIRQMESIGVQFSILPTDIPLEINPKEEK